MPTLLWTSCGPVLVRRESRVNPSFKRQSPSRSRRRSPPTKERDDDDDDDDDEKPRSREAKRTLRAKRKAARRAQRLSIARLAQRKSDDAPPAGGEVWDPRIGCFVLDAKRSKPFKDDECSSSSSSSSSSMQNWVVFVSTDRRIAALDELCERVVDVLARTGCAVRVDVEPPEPCATCVAVHAGRARRCRKHAGPRPHRPPRGAFDVYAMRWPGPRCWPPCLACGQPDGHAYSVETFVGGYSRPVVVYRLCSRFAEAGKLPTPLVVRRRLRRVARAERADEADGNDGDLEKYADQILDDQEPIAPELARELADVFKATHRRGQCCCYRPSKNNQTSAPACAPTSARASTDVEAPMPAYAAFDDDDDCVPEAPPPPPHKCPTDHSVASPSTKSLVVAFAALRAKLRTALGARASDVNRLRALVGAWEAAGFAACDGLIVRARTVVASCRADDDDTARSGAQSACGDPVEPPEYRPSRKSPRAKRLPSASRPRSAPPTSSARLAPPDSDLVEPGLVSRRILDFVV